MISPPKLKSFWYCVFVTGPCIDSTSRRTKSQSGTSVAVTRLLPHGISGCLPGSPDPGMAEVAHMQDGT